MLSGNTQFTGEKTLWKYSKSSSSAYFVFVKQKFLFSLSFVLQVTQCSVGVVVLPTNCLRTLCAGESFLITHRTILIGGACHVQGSRQSLKNI